MSIKLLALDLDGTTLDSSSSLPEENKRTLEEAIERGINVVVASGRCFKALNKEVMAIKGMQYAISSNGAKIRDLLTGKDIYSNCITPSAISRVRDLVKDINADLEVFVDGTAYMERAVWEDIRDNGSGYRRRDYVVNTRNPVDDIVGFMMENDDEIENINFVLRDLSEKPEIGKLLATLGDETTLTTSFDFNWEIGGKTTSKAGAIKELCGILGISMEETMAFGDNPNDIPMVSAAGIGVAVGNAKDSVKEAADYIAPSNDDAGVAEAIRRFAFGENR